MKAYFTSLEARYDNCSKIIECSMDLVKKINFQNKFPKFYLIFFFKKKVIIMKT